MSKEWLLLWIGLALVLIPLQFFVAAPYGRHTSKSWGPQINSKLGWVVMELVALIAFLGSFISGSGFTPVTLFIAGIFTLHYMHRSIIYPMMTRTGNKGMPLVIALFAVMFNSFNGFVNGEYLGIYPESYPAEYFYYPRFYIGLAIFIVGAIINNTSDYYLISLRRSGDSDKYYIPEGRLFNWISCPNHLGEMIQWTGFAVLVWNLPALAFAIWTASNLIPRAWHHHKWYKRKFPDYPKQRKAVIPGIL